MSKKILIAGCGDIGSRLGTLLMKDGHQVWAIRRNTDKLPKGFQPIALDLANPIDASLLPNDLCAVYCTIAASEKTDAGYKSAYVDGVENLLAGLAGQTKLERLVFVSSTSVYGQRGGAWVDEESPTDPERFNGQRMLEAENKVSASPWTSTCVRFGGIYGAGRERLLQSVLSGTAKLKDPERGSTPFYTNRIHQDDCAGILACLLESSNPPGILIGVDNNPAPYNTVLSWMADQCGTPLSSEPHANPGSSNKRCKDVQLRELGYELLYPSFRHGYRPLIAQSKEATSNAE